MGSGGSSNGANKPVWDPRKPVASGSDKDVFMGMCKGKAVAICVAKRQGELRLAQEIEILTRLGKHEHIVTMLFSEIKPGRCYLALEAVEPLGFDLDRMMRQYLFAKQSVPSQLTRRLISQLCGALDHMHSLDIIHRDVKVENVLVTTTYDAKLIDMGIACEVGRKEARWIWAAKSYFAPEMCQGNVPQGTPVDAWGLGVVLHQMHQHRWDLVDASRDVVQPRPDRPLTSSPMEENIMEAMFGLLTFDPRKRWTTKMCLEKLPENASEGRDGWHTPTGAQAQSRKYLCEYKDVVPLTAYAAIVDSKSKHLHGQTVQDLAFRKETNAILLLLDVPDPSKDSKKARVMEKSPNKDTVIVEGAWLYFGLPPSDDTEEAVAGLKNAIFPEMESEHVGRSVNTKAGLMAFSLDFDCFTFPDHVGKNTIIGCGVADTNAMQLNLRGNFGLNLAGIKRAKSQETLWFPGPAATVDAGDLGLVVRCPCQDGTTEPTMTDEELAPLMNKEQFEKIMTATGQH